MREVTHCTINRNLRPRCAARTSSSGRKRDAAVRSDGGGGAGTLVSRGAWLVVVMSTQIVEVVVRVGRWVEDDVNFVNKGYGGKPRWDLHPQLVCNAPSPLLQQIVFSCRVLPVSCRRLSTESSTMHAKQVLTTPPPKLAPRGYTTSHRRCAI